MHNTKTKKEQIEEICGKGYQLDFGTVFENAFENYKKIVLYAGLMFLVFSILISIILITGLISYVGIEHMEEFGNKMKQLSTLKVMPLDIALPLNAGLLLFSAIISPFMAGFFKMADCGEKGEEFHVSTMFTYYKFPYFLNIILSIIIIGVLSTGLAMFLENAGLGFVGTVTNLLISFLTFLTIPLIVFSNLNVADALKYSVLLVLKQPLILLGLTIVAGIGSILGIFGLCIGIFFTLPFMYSMNYIIYKNIIGVDETSEITQIGTVQD
ncbi:hypothetical protein [Flavobacterium franklandianum]|uniref:Beta-carotene 15,15'-monooxygenase n=1 Tax=Flavobacterium franklandianum TaxID=2594430 RepID=A0A553C6C3_9FLAO|nr:hypothetical protein [Flavobacterium franklandianum]TRX16048.1 hypothetical protein FNW17_15065 [Flavobacterium franklandianum]